MKIIQILEAQGFPFGSVLRLGSKVNAVSFPQLTYVPLAA